MEYLIQFAQRQDVRDIVNIAMESPIVQGIVLDIDPFWIYSWRLMSYMGEERFNNVIKAMPYGYPGSFLWDTGPNDYYIPERPIDEHDLKYWRPPYWDDYLRMNGLPDLEMPIIVKVCLLPYGKEQGSFLPDVQGFSLPVVFETRPPAFLYANPKRKYRPLVGGISIDGTKRDYGTLGGILRDDKGNYFGLTCAHVLWQSVDVNQPAREDSRYSSMIGTSILRSDLHPSDKNERCNPYNTWSTLNEIDAAIIRLDPHLRANSSVLDIGELSGITPKSWLVPTQTVEITGRSSGHNTYKVGGLAATYIFSFNKVKYCFINLFEVSWPRFRQTVLQRPIKPGDSGAWVCNPSEDGFSWCGMVMGGDRKQGYAIFSESIADWWREEENLFFEVGGEQFITT